jgi:hypothetical protein
VQGGHKFRAGGVVFHGVRIAVRIRQDLATGVDDSSARTEQPAGVGGYLLDFVGRSAADLRDKEYGLLAQRCFDLTAQHVFPGPVNQHIHRQRADGNDEQGRYEQLDEDAILHGLGTSKRYPAPRTVFK